MVQVDYVQLDQFFLFNQFFALLVGFIYFYLFYLDLFIFKLYKFVLMEKYIFLFYFNRKK